MKISEMNSKLRAEDRHQYIIQDELIYERDYPAIELLDFKPDYAQLGIHKPVLDAITNFNRKWNVELKATNTFRFSPGYKKMLRQRANRIMWPRYDKNTSIELMFRRNNWSYENFVSEAKDVERQVKSLRLQGLTLDKSIDDGEEAWDLFLSTLTSSGMSEYVKDIFISNAGHGLRHRWMNRYDRDRVNSKPKDTPYLVIVIPLRDIIINVFGIANQSGIIDQEGRNNYRQIVAQIPYGDLDIMFEYDLYAWANNYLNPRADSWASRRDRYYNIQCHGITMPEIPGTYHPFVQRSITDGFSIGNICFGDMLEDILECLHAMDWETMQNKLEYWCSTFICGETGPLNGISDSAVGHRMQYVANTTFPVQFLDDLDKRVPISTATCSRVLMEIGDNDTMKTTYCDDCNIQSTCSLYADSISDEVNRRIIELQEYVEDRWGEDYSYLYTNNQNRYLAGFNVRHILRESSDITCIDDETGRTIFSEAGSDFIDAFVTLFILKKGDPYYTYANHNIEPSVLPFETFAKYMNDMGCILSEYKDMVTRERRLRDEIARQEAALAALEENNNTDEEEVSETTEENILERYPQVAEELRRIANRENL